MNLHYPIAFKSYNNTKTKYVQKHGWSDLIGKVWELQKLQKYNKLQGGKTMDWEAEIPDPPTVQICAIKTKSSSIRFLTSQ